MEEQMSVDFYDFKEDLKKREFNFKCKVIRKSVSFKDTAYEDNQQADLVLLVPYEGTERDMFMSAYYQDAFPVETAEKQGVASKVELPTFVGSPCSMPSMVRLSWPTAYYEHPHLMVMSVHMESLLNSYKEIDTIELRVFPYEKMDELGLSDGRVRI
jgi:hypothetical protein